MAQYDITSMISKPPKKDVHSVDKLPSTAAGQKSIVEKVDMSLKNVKFKQGWETIGTHLIRNISTVPALPAEKVKVAAFDLDGTLIDTKSGAKFSRGPGDWKWWGKSPTMTPQTVAKYFNLGHLIVIFTNQGAVVANKDSKSYSNLRAKLNLIYNELAKYKVESIYVYASPKKPSKGSTSTEEQHKLTRKPAIGIWQDLESVLAEKGKVIDYENSFYVGDAAGRKQDFSDSDFKFAENAKISFKTPEEFF
ncbi:pnk1 [Candida margitis]|uniref:pnk1 n=1 Tax=Candida margitis TaxID=1775924 RepID=UPI00222702F6|nr:pnk1 [Candida margitis]KAI5954098.1 pnk1 [Candida margitis]